MVAITKPTNTYSPYRYPKFSVCTHAEQENQLILTRKSMNVCMQNCLGITKKAGTIRRAIEGGNIDILILVETHLKKDHIKLFNSQIGYRKHPEKVLHDYSHLNDYKGVSIIIRKELCFQVNEVMLSGNGSFVAVNGTHRNKNIIITGVYGNPSGSDLLSLRTITKACNITQKMIDSNTESIVMFCGDFNCITSAHDHSNMLYRRKPCTEAKLKDFVKRNNLIDVHLDSTEGIPKHTFRRPNRDKWTTARLDRIYFSEKQIVKPKFSTDSLLQSDHLSLTYNWHHSDPKIQKKFPDYLLKTNELQTILHNSIRETLIINSTDEALKENYYDTIPEDPFIKKHEEFIERINIERKKPLKLRARIYHDEQFIDMSNKYKLMKIRQFAQKFSSDPQEHDSIISLNHLGHATADSTNKPESVLIDILTKCVEEGISFKKKLKKKKSSELDSIKEKIKKHEEKNLPYNQNYRKLIQKRKKIEEEINYKNKFYRMAKYNATTSKYTSYFLSDSMFTPKKGFDNLIDAEGLEHKEEQATLFAKNFFETFFTEQSTSAPATESTIPEFLKNIPIDKIKKIPQSMLERYKDEITAYLSLSIYSGSQITSMQNTVETGSHRAKLHSKY